MNKQREDGALKPIGLALTAVVAGLGAASGAGANAAVEIASAADATRDVALREVLQPFVGEAVEPFSEPARQEQPDLFEL